MPRFMPHTVETAPDGSKALLQTTLKTKGRIPGLAGTMAEAPPLFATYKFAHEQFLNTSLTDEEKTVVWQTVNVEQNCHYCFPAHTRIAKVMKVDEQISDALRNETPLPTNRLEALRTFTLQMVRNRGAVSKADTQLFLEAGFTQTNVLEIILGIAQKVMSNYTNHVAETPLDKPLEPFAWEKTTEADAR